MITMSNIEVRYYTPNKGWKTKSFKSERAYDRWAESMSANVIIELAEDRF